MLNRNKEKDKLDNDIRTKEEDERDRVNPTNRVKERVVNKRYRSRVIVSDCSSCRFKLVIE